MKSFRLILDVPRPAALNMAVDEFLLEQSRKENLPPVLRIYSWLSPAYSAGYFQNVDSLAEKIRGKHQGVAIVKRPTGGGLVFHGDDLTFSLVMPYPNEFFPNDTKTSYLKINEALMTGLRKLYPGLDFADCKTIPSGRGKGERICFDSPACYDLLLDGKKVVGSSQRRSAGRLLHQSTVFLKGGKPLLTGKMLEGFREKWGIDFAEQALSGQELEAAAALEKERYSQPAWATCS